jgi:hypothetical protein
MVNHGLVIIGAGYVSFSEVRRKAVPGGPSCRVIRDAVYIRTTLAEAVESAVAAIDELAGLSIGLSMGCSIECWVIDTG